MYQKHIIYVIDTTNYKRVYQSQILSINSHFDKQFYKNMNIKIDENGEFGPVKINIKDFIYEVDSWLNRHPEERGISQVSTHIRENFTKNELKEFLVSHYSNIQSYEQQFYIIVNDIKKYVELDGTQKKPFEIYFEHY